MTSFMKYITVIIEKLFFFAALNTSMIKKYLSISIITGGGMVLSIFSDLSIGKLTPQNDIDKLVISLTLIVAYDILSRESLRFSLLHVFSETNNIGHKSERYCDLIAVSKSIGIGVSCCFSCLYIFLTKNYLGSLFYLTIFFLFYFIFLSSVCQLILNINGFFKVTSSRIFILPMSIIIWLYSGLNIRLELSMLSVFVSYLIFTNYFLNNALIKTNLSFDIKTIKRFCIPVLSPIANYSSLQTSRYIERDLGASILPGSAYTLYFSSKIYASIISLISMPMSTILSKKLVEIGTEKYNVSSLMVKLTFIILAVWIIVVLTVLTIISIPEFKEFFPLISDNHFRDILLIYLFASLFGCFNVPAQAILYRMRLHKSISKIIILLNIIYISALCIITSFGDKVDYSMVVYFGLCFLIYTASELVSYLYILRKHAHGFYLK